MNYRTLITMVVSLASAAITTLAQIEPPGISALTSNAAQSCPRLS
jgi:hypothetical protein